MLNRLNLWLSIGFRPFFPLAALWAVLAMGLWIAALSGSAVLDYSRFGPIAWHAHEFLFGYLVAVVTGFLLTSVPNWTGRPPLSGAPLATLVALWIIGRVAVLFSATLPVVITAVADMSCLIAVTLWAGYEIIAARKKHNLIVLAIISILIGANGLFHWQDGSGVSQRLALAAAVMLIALIGGRIVPTFTRNWLKKRDHTNLPVTMNRADGIILVLSALVLGVWVGAPDSRLTALLLGLIGLAHLWRMARWQGSQTIAEPLLLILHLAYGFIPLGALILSIAILWPEVSSTTAAQHLWMVGAIGLMTLAVMTRAILGHTGRALRAGGGTVGLYTTLIACILARVAAGIWPQFAIPLYYTAGLLWCATFGGFVLIYGPMTIAPHIDQPS